jgi:hypothetical protein
MDFEGAVGEVDITAMETFLSGTFIPHFRVTQRFGCRDYKRCPERLIDINLSMAKLEHTHG